MILTYIKMYMNVNLSDKHESTKYYILLEFCDQKDNVIFIIRFGIFTFYWRNCVLLSYIHKVEL